MLASTPIVLMLVAAPPAFATFVAAGHVATASANASAQPDAWLLALASGFAGAVITVLAERLVARRQERRALLALLEPVEREVAAILSQSQHRAGRAEDAPFPFDQELPAQAWSILRTSGIAWRLSSKRALFRSLATLYEAVEDANHRGRVAVTLFHLSQGSERTALESSEYLSRAIRLSIDPYVSVAALAATAASELAKETLPR